MAQLAILLKLLSLFFSLSILISSLWASIYISFRLRISWSWLIFNSLSLNSILSKRLDFDISLSPSTSFYWSLTPINYVIAECFLDLALGPSWMLELDRSALFLLRLLLFSSITIIRSIRLPCFLFALLIDLDLSMFYLSYILYSLIFSFRTSLCILFSSISLG